MQYTALTYSFLNLKPVHCSERANPPVQFSSIDCSVISLRPHGLQHSGPPSPSSSPGTYSNSCPLQIRQWHPTTGLLPGKSHGQRSLVGRSSWGLQRVRHDWALHFHFSFLCIGEGNGNPLQCSCLENPRDGRAWWAAVCGVTQSWTRLKWRSSSSSSMSIELVMPSNNLILCCPLLLPSSIFPSIRIFSNESVLCIRWPKYWSFNFSISPSNEYSRLISFRMDWLDLLAVQGTDSQESSPTPQFKSISSSVMSFLYSPTLTHKHNY